MLLARLALQALFVTALLAANVDHHGLPACDAPRQELADRVYFVLCHDASRKVPAWVAYELTPEHLSAAQPSPRTSHFRADRELGHPGARDSDYRNSGYARGHLAPAADFLWSAPARRATFLLSNAVPQRQDVNAGLWAQLERHVRRLAALAETVYVISGPLFEGPPEFIGAGQVAVPTHFFKVVLAEQQGRRTLFAAIVPNESTQGKPLGQFLTTVQEVERRTGLDFFAGMGSAEQRLLESCTPAVP